MARFSPPPPGAGSGASPEGLAVAPPEWGNWLARHKVLTAAGALVVIVGTAGATGAARGGSTSPATSLPSAEAVVDAAPALAADITSPPPAVAYVPKPSDFTISIKIRNKDCFGSGGCNLSYRIVPSYSGLPFEGSYDVTYRVTGDEDGPQIDTFTIDEDGTATFDSEEMASTASSHTVLKAKATDVSPS